MRKTLITQNPAITAFIPRQVLLANPNMKHSNATTAICGSDVKPPCLKPDQKSLLLYSIAQFLDRNGFSKTLKKFRSEAEIEKEGFKGSPLELEEMFYKYSETCNLGNAKKMDSTTNKDEEGDGVTVVETVSKKKKKRNDESDNHVVNNHSEAVVQSTDSKKSKEMMANDAAPEFKAKSKEKKKSKKISDAPDQEKDVSLEVSKEPADNTVSESKLDESNKKSKDKKKKKSHHSVPVEEKSGINSEIHNETIDKDNLVELDGATNKMSMSSKKRKRLASEENYSPRCENVVEESKRRKKELGGIEKPVKANASLGSDEIVGNGNKADAVKIGLSESQKTVVENLDGHANGYLGKSGDKSAVQKSMKKERNGSFEPTSAKAFQRVKIEEVEFKDKRLQDNSYWAKDGAEIGYGAKAQEILGQVRGRDFRHEKTKKKRGSYRGGLIDQQTHSVKFNYSDED